MSTELNHDAILDDFAMEDPIAPETLRTYIGKYPSLAVELTDLYHELLLVDLIAAADGIELETKSAVVSSQQDVVFVANALSGSNLRNLAKKLGLPRDYIAGFRDRKFRLGSVPGALLTKLARSASVNIHQLMNHLQDTAGSTQQMAHKADEKPQSSAPVEYDEFVEGLALDEKELEALNRLSVSDGSD